jgi:hypothetical protein
MKLFENVTRLADLKYLGRCRICVIDLQYVSKDKDLDVEATHILDNIHHPDDEEKASVDFANDGLVFFLCE